MNYARHKHFYRLVRRHNHPPGYLFQCERCSKANSYPFKFIRLDTFWG